MKRRISANKGFTLVEVMVAFMIFGIMAAMVAVLLNTTLAVKRENLDIEENIDRQAKAYYLSERDKEFKSDDGTIAFDFSGGTIDFDFQVGYEGDEEDLLKYEYIIGDVDYDSHLTGGGGSSGMSGSVADRLDSRILVTKGIDSISLKAQDMGTKDGGYMYKFAMLINSGSLDPDYEYFAQIKMIFPDEIIGYGYYAGGVPTTNTYGIDFRMKELTNNTIRFGSAMPSGAPKSTDKSMFTEASYKNFYVILSSPINVEDLNEIFGYSDSEKTSTKAGDSFLFTPYIEYVYDSSGGIKDTIEHVNVLGGYPKAPAVDDSTAEAEETSES